MLPPLPAYAALALLALGAILGALVFLARVTISIGVAGHQGERSLDIDALLREAAAGPGSVSSSA